jgi:hypothetical protein
VEMRFAQADRFVRSVVPRLDRRSVSRIDQMDPLKSMHLSLGFSTQRTPLHTRTARRSCRDVLYDDPGREQAKDVANRTRETAASK